jgi:tetratricopeptide (TPR) repeat protein/mono/diheme cytochrome c family protein
MTHAWRAALAVALAAAGMPACGWSPLAAARSDPPTFTADVAPILYKNCATCHHSGGPGPFPLLTYADARKHARQIAKVTVRRYMPPWQPEPGHGRFVGERRLADADIAILAAWAAANAPEGDPSRLPSVPTFPAGWQLGTPDLVLRSPEPFVVPAEGGDVFWNLVLPSTVTHTTYIRAMEILPGNARLVHHANVLLDTSGTGRALDARTPGPGFPGMDLELSSNRFEPDSHFLFWKPGTPALVERPDMPWRLDPGTDLIFNMHLQPSGRAEPIQPAIGLYFAAAPATRVPMLLQLEHDGALDIPAGADFEVTDTLVLPVPVQVLGVYPHAHYLGKIVEGTAKLPDGSTRWLIRISDWDMKWQGVYQLAEPLQLPKGAVLSMRWVFDNSSANKRNPHTPPERVRGGNRAIDEMAHLWIQVLPDRPDDRLLLQEALMRARLTKYPGDFVALANLGSALQSQGRTDEAISTLRQALEARPDSAVVTNTLATALRDANRPAEALTAFQQALRLDPGYVDAEYNLATTLLSMNRPGEAVTHLQHVISVHPADAAALADLGAAYAMLRRLNQAVSALEASIRIAPGNAQAHYNLGLIAASQRDMPRAVREFEEALRLDPSNKDTEAALGEARAALGTPHPAPTRQH